MWLFTKVGFFSVVLSSESKPEVGNEDDVLSIRARIKGDLEKLRSSYAPELTDTIELPGRDYPYRAYISKEKFAAAMCRAALDVDYGNFKSMIHRTVGLARELLYSKVWGVMNGSDEKLAQLERGRR